MVKHAKQSVMRNLTKSLIAVSILAPASAYSLGVGDITLYSTLNQNLHAEIALFVSPDENISEINVRLAPPDKFDDAGIPWSFFLTKIKFESVTKADGSMLVKLSSNEVLREPFLDFLLEVSWAKGNLYREFTVLVDPPAVYTQPIIAVVEKAILETQPPEALAETIGVVADKDRLIIQYGPTGSADTLWAIAKETNTYSDVSIEQMMVAIYEANPRAFYKDNVNALMAGETLDIPGKEVILRLSSTEALTVFKQQENVWKGTVSTVTQNKPLTPIESIMITQLELEAPAEEEIAEEVVIIESELLSESVDKSTVEKPEPLAVVSTRDESLALLARLEKLEKDLLMMQKMLAMKDEEIAALQSQQQVITTPEITSVEEKVKETMPETGFLSGLTMTLLSGIAFIVLAALAWLWSRNKKAELESDAGSMFAKASEISLPDSIDDSSVSMIDSYASDDVEAVGGSSFLSEFTPSDFDSFDTDQHEIDPISEADVYLAYGRYQHAEDLVRQAIIDQPDNDEYKLKLLEIFHASENKAAFEEFSTELISAGKHNDHEFWCNVVHMGGEIAPDSSLFTDQASINVDLNTEDLSQDAELSDNGNELPAPSTQSDDSEIGGVSDTVVYDLSSFDETRSGEEISEDKAVVDDFDLSVFDTDEASFDTDVEADIETGISEGLGAGAGISSNSVEQGPQQVDEEVKATLDFHNEIDSGDKASIEADTNAHLNSGNELDKELESFDFSQDRHLPEATGLAKNESAKELDDFEEFDFDFNTKTAFHSDALEALDTGVSDLTDMDEIETKIDLAKTYLAMGDEDAARVIAGEVIKKGNEQQKVTAQAIIGQLK